MICVPPRRKHKYLVTCVPYRGNTFSWSRFPKKQNKGKWPFLDQNHGLNPLENLNFSRLQNWPSDRCFLTRETHIPSDMFSPTKETQISSDMCSPRGKHLSLVTCDPKRETHIPSDMCSPRGKHISLVTCVPPPRKHILLG